VVFAPLSELTGCVYGVYRYGTNRETGRSIARAIASKQIDPTESDREPHRPETGWAMHWKPIRPDALQRPEAEARPNETTCPRSGSLHRVLACSPYASLEAIRDV
jgi:hypothetical protein